MTGTYYACNISYYAEKASLYLNKIHRELFHSDSGCNLCPEARMYLDSINEHVRAINALLDPGALL